MFVVCLMLIGLSFIYGQKASITISHTVTYDSLSVLPASIKVTNMTHGGDTTLYGADTTLVLDYTTGLSTYQSNRKSLLVTPNYPNPFRGKTYFNVIVPEKGQMIIKVYDVTSREVTNLSAHYPAGNHKFLFATAKEGLYFLNVSLNDKTTSIKVYSIGWNDNSDHEINYLGSIATVSNKLTYDINSFAYIYGDELRSIVHYNTMSDTAIYTPTQDTLIRIDFQSSSSCPASFTDTRDNHVYSAVQIGSQCWMTENLAYLPSVSPSSAGSEATPYYYVHGYQGTSVSAAMATSNFKTYGVLYNWPAAMNGASSSNYVPSGVQGVCPNGWHLPSDEEWKILEGEVDSQYGYPDPEWDGTGFRGSDAGGNLKETGTTHWLSPNAFATNSSGFTALPAGGRYGGTFYDLHFYAKLWSSTEYISTMVWFRQLYHSGGKVYRNNLNLKSDGFSTRCLKD